MEPLVERLLAVGSARRLRPGEVLFTEGDASDDVYVIRAGRLLVGTAAGLGVTLGPGEIVGELAAVTGARRTATVSAGEESEVVVVSAASFESELSRIPAAAAALGEEAVRRLDRTLFMNLLTSVTGPLTPEVAAEIEEGVEWLRLPAGSLLFRAGDPADAAYVVLSGRVSVERETPQGGVVVELGPGELVGELGIVDSAPRTADVRARRDTTLVRLERSIFERLLTRYPAIMLQVGRMVLTRTAGVRSEAHALTVALAGTDTSFRERFVAETRRFGPVTVLDSGAVDAALGRQGIAQTGSGDVGEYRLVELLHRAETAGGTVVYVLDGDTSSPWSTRVLAHADGIVRVVTAPTGDVSWGEATGRRWLVLSHPPETVDPVGTASLVAASGGATILHMKGPEDIARVARTVNGRATGLVLSGGGARGFAHLGVYRALTELGVEVDMVAGSSIGSVMAAAMARRIPVSELVPVAARQFKGLLDYTVPVVSLVKGERITASISDTFGDADIADLWLPFVCVSTNLTRSTLEVHRSGPVARALRASVAIPGVIPPVPLGDDLLVDGGVLDNLPVDALRTSFDPGTVIAVDVAPSVGPLAGHDFGLSVSGWQALRSRMTKGARYPGTVALILRSMITASLRERDRQVAGGAVDLYLDLDLRGVGMLDFESVEPVARRGYEAALPRVEAWLAESAR